MIGVVWYLRWCSLKNGLLSKWALSRHPIYAVAFLVGLVFAMAWAVIYLGWMVIGLRAMPTYAYPSGFPEKWVEWGAIILGLIYLMLIWVFRQVEPGLNLKPPEVHYLLTSPLSPRSIIHYCILRAQWRVLTSALTGGILFSYFVPLTTPIRGIVAFLALNSVVLLNQTAASLRRARTQPLGLATERSSRRRTREAFIYPVFIYALLMLLFREGLPEDGGPVEMFLRQAFDSPVGYVVFYPLRAFGGLFVAHDFGAFLSYLATAIVIIVVYYVCLVRMVAQFKLVPRRRANVLVRRIERKWKDLEAWLRRRQRRKPRSLPLRPDGPAPVGFLWKNLITANRQSSNPAGLATVVTVVGLLLGFALEETDVMDFLDGLRGWGALPTLIIPSLVFLMVGSAVICHDLRSDLPHLDVLKRLPLSGTDIFFGEVLGSLVFLWMTEILFCACLFLLPVSLGKIPATVAGLLCVTLLLLLPPVTLLWVVIENGLALYYVEWAHSLAGEERSLANTGASILYILVKFLALWLLLLPALIVFGVALFVAYPFVQSELGWLLVLPGIAVGFAAVIGYECYWLIQFLGRKFENLDLTADVYASGES